MNLQKTRLCLHHFPISLLFLSIPLKRWVSKALPDVGKCYVLLRFLSSPFLPLLQLSLSEVLSRTVMARNLFIAGWWSILNVIM